MTVKELIEILLKYDQNLPVTTANFEYGFDELDQINLVEVLEADPGSSYEPADLHSSGNRMKALCLGPVAPSLLAQARHAEQN